MVNCYTHKITEVTVSGSVVALTADNSTDIGNLEPFSIVMKKTISGVVAEPVPVTINVNNAAVPLKNRFGQQILSNRVPLGYSLGYYVEDELEPYVILLSTPPISKYA